MSTGLVICDQCRREVHQDGPASSWQHCEDQSPICVGASRRYPQTPEDIVGKYCGRDGLLIVNTIDLLPPAPAERELVTPTVTQSRRVLGRGLPALMAMSAMMPVRLPGEPRRPSINQLTHGADPQLAADRWRERQQENTPHQGPREKARRRRQMDRDAAKAAKRAARSTT